MSNQQSKEGQMARVRLGDVIISRSSAQYGRLAVVDSVSVHDDIKGQYFARSKSDTHPNQLLDKFLVLEDEVGILVQVDCKKLGIPSVAVRLKELDFERQQIEQRLQRIERQRDEFLMSVLDEAERTGK